MQRRQSLFFLTLLMLFSSCNSLYRKTQTRVRLSPEVAQYLRTTNLEVQSNTKNNHYVRKAQIITSRKDSQHYLVYNKVVGNTVGLYITDSFGNQRILAIPQIKLLAYPFSLTTTITAPTFYLLSTAKTDRPDKKAIAVVFVYVVTSIEAQAMPILLAFNYKLRHAKFIVPDSFSITQLDSVQTRNAISNPNPSALTPPINPHPTAFLNAHYRRRYQYVVAFNQEFGLSHENRRKILFEQTARANVPNELNNGIWRSAGLYIQPNPHYQWGYSYHTKVDPKLTSQYVINEISFLRPIKKGTLEIGGGLGVGVTKRIHGTNAIDTFSTYKNKPLPAKEYLEEAYTSVNNKKYTFVPVEAHAQLIYPLKKRLEIAASARFSSVPSYSDYIKDETILSSQKISPTIMVYRRDNVVKQAITIKSIYYIYSFGLSLRYKI